MSRVTKDPQIRMTEIIDVAEELFNDRGYQETQISDIVKAIGVAQGHFIIISKPKKTSWKQSSGEMWTEFSPKLRK